MNGQCLQDILVELDRDWRPTERYDQPEFMGPRDRPIINHGPLKRGQHRYAHIMRTTTSPYKAKGK